MKAKILCASFLLFFFNSCEVCKTISVEEYAPIQIELNKLIELSISNLPQKERIVKNWEFSRNLNTTTNSLFSYERCISITSQSQSKLSDEISFQTAHDGSIYYEFRNNETYDEIEQSLEKRNFNFIKKIEDKKNRVWFYYQNNNEDFKILILKNRHPYSSHKVILTYQENIENEINLK